MKITTELEHLYSDFLCQVLLRSASHAGSLRGVCPTFQQYQGTLLIRKSALLRPYSRTMPRALWKPYGGGMFLMSEAPLHTLHPYRWGTEELSRGANS
jgi:hypothetical protein